MVIKILYASLRNVKLITICTLRCFQYSLYVMILTVCDSLLAKIILTVNCHDSLAVWQSDRLSDLWQLTSLHTNRIAASYIVLCSYICMNGTCTPTSTLMHYLYPSRTWTRSCHQEENYQLNWIFIKGDNLPTSYRQPVDTCTDW